MTKIKSERTKFHSVLFLINHGFDFKGKIFEKKINSILNINYLV